MSEYDREDKPGTEYDEMIIDTKGVKVNFGDFWALKGIDISVKKGEIIVILGPSGSGKSTYIRTLNRLQPHSGGTVVIDGITVDDDTTVADMKYIRAEIGFVFQQFNLFPHLTIMENITLAQRKVRGRGKAEAEEEAGDVFVFGAGQGGDYAPGADGWSETAALEESPDDPYGEAITVAEGDELTIEGPEKLEW